MSTYRVNKPRKIANPYSELVTDEGAEDFSQIVINPLIQRGNSSHQVVLQVARFRVSQQTEQSRRKRNLGLKKDQTW